CLAHIVNLATQAFISAHSKSKPFDPEKPDEELIARRENQFDELSAAEDDEGPPELVTQRDKIGLVRTIIRKAKAVVS
ncbi:hypothetical protein C0992_012672, partial [Termitomyces sp. T32_za158]